MKYLFLSVQKITTEIHNSLFLFVSTHLLVIGRISKKAGYRGRVIISPIPWNGLNTDVIIIPSPQYFFAMFLFNLLSSHFLHGTSKTQIPEFRVLEPSILLCNSIHEHLLRQWMTEWAMMIGVIHILGVNKGILLRGPIPRLLSKKGRVALVCGPCIAGDFSILLKLQSM